MPLIDHEWSAYKWVICLSLYHSEYSNALKLNFVFLRVTKLNHNMQKSSEAALDIFLCSFVICNH